MTTQVLMSSNVLLSNPTAATALRDDQHPIEAAQASQPPASVAVEPRKLPYRANHQVELLHLQAETEALLQRLQTLKQQRLSDFDSEGEFADGEPTEANLVASR